MVRKGGEVEADLEGCPPGQALRELRQQRGATLKQFSEATGYPVSTLSKLETGKLGMSYSRLVRLSKALHVDLAELIRTEGDRPLAPRDKTVGRREITRAGTGPIVTTPVYSYRYPASELLGKEINPMFIDVTARSISEFDEMMRHPGEEFALVLQGQIEFHCESYRPSLLDPGDSVYFDGMLGHAYVAISPGKCQILSICSAGDDELRSARAQLNWHE